MRRLHSPSPVAVGEVWLDKAEAHHARDVLRLQPGEAVEVFDDSGSVGRGVIARCTSGVVTVRVESVQTPGRRTELVVASALPKGERADWMVEKLSELGVSRFIPLVTARSVVKPRGSEKEGRWRRLALESAKQSRRSGVMRIETIGELIPVVSRTDLLRIAMVTECAAPPLANIALPEGAGVMVIVGPEGGWEETELSRMQVCGVRFGSLTETILRTETAAVCAAGVFACRLRGSG